MSTSSETSLFTLFSIALLSMVYFSPAYSSQTVSMTLNCAGQSDFMTCSDLCKKVGWDTDQMGGEHMLGSSCSNSHNYGDDHEYWIEYQVDWNIDKKEYDYKVTLNGNCEGMVSGKGIKPSNAIPKQSGNIVITADATISNCNTTMCGWSEVAFSSCEYTVGQ